MDPIIPALATGGVLLYGYMFSRWRFLSWQRMARQCVERGRLQGVKVSGWAGKWEIQGQAGRLQVRISATGFDRSTSQVVIVIPGPPGFSEISIRREDQNPWKTREIETGSEDFDDTFFVAGPVKLVHALLDSRVRGLLLKVNDAFTFAGSRLEIAGVELLVETVEPQLPFLLPLLLNLGERFAKPADVERLLAHNATRDPVAGVRLKNLLLLVHEFPGGQRTLKVLRSARSDGSPKVRLEAAKALGTKGHTVLLQLADGLRDDDVSAEAISILHRDLSVKHMETLLRRALRKHRAHPQTVRACLEALGRSEHASAVDLLAEVMEQQQGDVAVCAAHALGSTGSPAAEGPLIRALQGDEVDLRVAAANALGRIGSPAAVLPLQEAAKRFALRDPELSRAAHQAIAEIQSRVSGASPGQLSLAGGEAGQLSLTEAEAGQLSIATDQAGQLSISGANGEQGED